MNYENGEQRIFESALSGVEAAKDALNGKRLALLEVCLRECHSSELQPVFSAIEKCAYRHNRKIKR